MTTIRLFLLLVSIGLIGVSIAYGLGSEGTAILSGRNIVLLGLVIFLVLFFSFLFPW